MTRIPRLARLLIRDTRGVTLVEYGIALIVAIAMAGGALTALSNAVSSNINDAEAQFGT